MPRLYDIYETYDWAWAKHLIITKNIFRQISKMKSVADEFKSQHHVGYVYLTLKPLVKRATIKYESLANALKPQLEMVPRRAEIGVTTVAHYLLENLIEDFKLEFYAPFIDIYRSFLRPKATALNHMVNLLEEDYRMRGGNDPRFEAAFFQASNGLEVLASLMNFDAFDPAQKVPKYQTIRYVMTQIFLFYNKMKALDLLHAIRVRVVSQAEEDSITRDRSFRERLQDISDQVSNLSTEFGLTPRRIMLAQTPSPEAPPVKRVKFHVPNATDSGVTSTTGTVPKRTFGIQKRTPGSGTSSAGRIRKAISKIRTPAAAITTRITPPGSRIPPPAARIPPAAARIPSPAARIPPPAARIPPPAARIPPPAARIPPPAARIPPPAARITPPATRIPPPPTGIRPPTTGIRPPTAGIRPPATRIRSPTSGIRPPTSGIRPPNSRGTRTHTTSESAAGIRPPAAAPPSPTQARRQATQRSRSPNRRRQASKK